MTKYPIDSLKTFGVAQAPQYNVTYADAKRAYEYLKGLRVVGYSPVGLVVNVMTGGGGGVPDWADGAFPGPDQIEGDFEAVKLNWQIWASTAKDREPVDVTKPAKPGNGRFDGVWAVAEKLNRYGVENGTQQFFEQAGIPFKITDSMAAKDAAVEVMKALWSPAPVVPDNPTPKPVDLARPGAHDQDNRYFCLPGDNSPNGTVFSDATGRYVKTVTPGPLPSSYWLKVA